MEVISHVAKYLQFIVGCSNITAVAERTHVRGGCNNNGVEEKQGIVPLFRNVHYFLLEGVSSEII